jgi:NTE family protein
MKIGLALGAGAARGWAHIGIIEALEEMGIQIDVVAGCSIGAYVGSAYTSGHLAELKEWACSLGEWQILSLLGVGINKGGIASGEKVFTKLADDFCYSTFEQMHKPLAVTATDLYTGREVVFKEGDVGDSIRASCAIPALFSPVKYQGRWLVDGAVVNPVPVNLCRQLGADIVIAVNLSADFRPEMVERSRQAHEQAQQKTDDVLSKSNSLLRSWFSPDKQQDEENEPAPPGIMSVMSNALDIMQARVTRSRLAGDPPHILIEPHLRDVGILEFNRAEELVAQGKEAVERLSQQIEYQLRYI